jgi:hypothetical protein
MLLACRSANPWFATPPVGEIGRFWLQVDFRTAEVRYFGNVAARGGIGRDPSYGRNSSACCLASRSKKAGEQLTPFPGNGIPSIFPVRRIGKRALGKLGAIGWILIDAIINAWAGSPDVKCLS